MSNSARVNFRPNPLAFGVMSVMLVALSTSRALLSISMVLLALIALWQLQQDGWRLVQQRPSTWRRAGIISTLFGIALLSGLNTDSTQLWIEDLYAKLPLVMIPFALAVLPNFSSRQKSWLSLIFLGSHSLIALFSIGGFLLNYAETYERIAKNASVDVATGMSHIYFGMILAFSVCLGLYLFLQKTQVLHPKERWLFLGLALFNFVALHLFTSRTGLAALYAGLGAGGLYYLIQQRAWGLGLMLLLGLTLMPLLAYYVIPSFRTRIEVTRWDYQQYQRPDSDISHNSVSLRLLAWETGWELFRARPFTGVGMREVKPTMAQAYQENNVFSRAKEPLVDPHNQYLHDLIGGGIIALLALISVLFFLPIQTLPPARLLAIAFIGGFMASMCFESIIQRQIGMSFFAIFYMLLPTLTWNYVYTPEEATTQV